MTTKRKPDTANRRTRHDPPTVEEAVAAAQGLTGDLEEQVTIAASLIGLPEDEVRPVVLNARSAIRTSTGRVPAGQRPVVIERRGQRTALHLPKRPG